MVMEIVISMMTLAGMGYAAFRGLKWMLKSGQQHVRKDESLTPNDLKVLEESAARLITDIHAAADECVARVETAVDQAEARLYAINEQYIAACGPVDRCSPTTFIESIGMPMAAVPVETVLENEPAAVVAKSAGMTTGEVMLLRNLQEMQNA